MAAWQSSVPIVSPRSPWNGSILRPPIVTPFSSLFLECGRRDRRHGQFRNRLATITNSRLITLGTNITTAAPAGPAPRYSRYDRAPPSPHAAPPAVPAAGARGRSGRRRPGKVLARHAGQTAGGGPNDFAEPDELGNITVHVVCRSSRR